MNYAVVGTNHKRSPIGLRERISFSGKARESAFCFLKRAPLIKSAVVLSTCNRVEIHAHIAGGERGLSEVEDFISRYHEIERGKVLPFLYRYTDTDAVRHLLSVASGLDSLILGETQILGQVRSALSECEGIGFADTFLKEIFCHAVSFAGSIQRDTTIAEGKVSAGSVAVDFIKEKVNALDDKTILIIGAGKVTGLVSRYLKDKGASIIFVATRTFEKAKALAGEIGERAIEFKNLKEYLKSADIIVSATASPHFVIRKETLEKATGKRLLIIDLALPRDIDPKIKELKNVELFCLEDLNTVIEKNIAKKLKVAEKIRKVIDIKAKALWKEITKSEQEPALSR
jgi:glutamyl-tRNA reductase